MPRNPDTSYMENVAEYSVESIDSPGIDEVLECPVGLMGKPKVLFEMFALDGKGKFRYEDVPALVELSKQVVLADHWDSECLRLVGQADNSETYDKALARAEKASRRASVLRKELGINPMSRVSVASRRRGAATLKMNGAPDTLGAARAQAVAALEEGRGSSP